jgi:hypothetical protein
MSRVETSEMIANQRVVTAAGLLNNQADLRGHPHRYLAIHSYKLLGGEGMRMAMAAMEYLDQFGWRLVNIVEVDNQIYAVMRRTD